MRSTTRWLVAVGLMGLIVLLVRARPGRDAVADQTRKPVIITRLYTGPDGQTHSEDMEVTLTGNPLNEVSEMLKVTGAEIHRAPPGKVSTWHTAPRRQYVITISGRGEIELADGKKIPLEPGHIELAEDLTGKGHITRVVGSEERVTIQLPLADQPSR
jgi:quercetin dioxygenase-like cupin family protein